jgi:HAD superfamily hydrolase (TIGR01450 family)
VLEGARGFVFDVDGTLVHRGPDGRGRPQPGAVDVLERIHASGRPLVLFTNGSHIGSEVIARGLREDGLPISDDEVLTPIESATSFLRRYHPGRPALLFASTEIAERMEGWGIPIARGEDAEVVFVAHVDQIEVSELERAARAVTRGAKLLTASYVPGYAGANGIVFSRGAMVTAAIAKVTSTRPRVVGKPSKIAVSEVGNRLGVPTTELAVIGDDLGMDIALGRLGGSKTVLVRTGISGQIALDSVPERRRPDAVVDGVADLLPWL